MGKFNIPELNDAVNSRVNGNKPINLENIIFSYVNKRLVDCNVNVILEEICDDLLNMYLRWSNLDTKYFNLENDLNTLINENEELKQYIDLLKDRYKSISKEKKDIESVFGKLANLGLEYDSLKSNYNSLENLISDYESLQDDYNSLKKNCDDLEYDYDNLRYYGE